MLRTDWDVTYAARWCCMHCYLGWRTFALKCSYTIYACLHLHICIHTYCTKICYKKATLRWPCPPEQRNYTIAQHLFFGMIHKICRMRTWLEKSCCTELSSKRTIFFVIWDTAKGTTVIFILHFRTLCHSQMRAYTKKWYLKHCKMAIFHVAPSLWLQNGVLKQ